EVLGAGPGEAKRVHLGSSRRTLRDGRECCGVQIAQVGLLGEQAAENAPVLREAWGKARAIAWDFEHPALLLRASERVERVGRERGRKEDLDEGSGERFHDAHVD